MRARLSAPLSLGTTSMVACSKAHYAVDKDVNVSNASLSLFPPSSSRAEGATPSTLPAAQRAPVNQARTNRSAVPGYLTHHTYCQNNIYEELTTPSGPIHRATCAPPYHTRSTASAWKLQQLGRRLHAHWHARPQRYCYILSETFLKVEACTDLQNLKSHNDT